jgi:hypothetical protein
MPTVAHSGVRRTFFPLTLPMKKHIDLIALNQHTLDREIQRDVPVLLKVLGDL